MKTVYIFTIILLTSACGSTPAIQPASTIELEIETAPTPVPTPESTVQTTPVATVEATPTPTTIVDTNVIVTDHNNLMMPAPTPTPTPVPTQTPDLLPVLDPNDPYTHVYPAVTLPLYADECAGSCAATVDVGVVSVTGNSGNYQANGLGARLSNGQIVWQTQSAGTIATCIDDIILETNFLGLTSRGYSRGESGTCHGGHSYTCICVYQ